MGFALLLLQRVLGGSSPRVLLTTALGAPGTAPGSRDTWNFPAGTTQQLAHGHLSLPLIGCRTRVQEPRWGATEPWFAPDAVTGEGQDSQHCMRARLKHSN